ncbi:MAG: hypothetical protein O2887_10070 [Bacteroidetes bacterium]|nr:hypothetical protein [Bacteroidota bacterium]MDA1120815.1 hypothetical protein [Bacteroidota bacterium]
MGSQVEERIVEWNEGESLKIDIYESKNIPMITGIVAEFKVMRKVMKLLLSAHSNTA